MPTLRVKNLKVAVEGKPILSGMNLVVKDRETHAIMGPNGSGKSTFAQSLFAHPKYRITGGQITFGKKMLNGLTADQIAKQGMMLAFQYPQSIPGVSVNNLVKLARMGRGKNKKTLDLKELVKEIAAKADALRIPKEFLSRSLNEGFSGGEKKKTEILQLLLLNPKLVILDETDSGLDVDALKLVARQINWLRGQGVAVILITHYNRILKYLRPDFVHVMSQGKIIKSGEKELA
ncbi:MAG: Fe-S cluster assembly ATPase SufC, partial [Candidatus Doudnabacteria bacterium]|nr:Fe-S cluster assembly ATPase SufC [Candidatus Doudnabacteria bacterium]